MTYTNNIMTTAQERSHLENLGGHFNIPTKKIIETAANDNYTVEGVVSITLSEQVKAIIGGSLGRFALGEKIDSSRVSEIVAEIESTLIGTSSESAEATILKNIENLKAIIKDPELFNKIENAI